MAHGVRDITPWAVALGAARSGPWAWPRPSAVGRGVRGPNALGRGVRS
jgi:hypothetical protein